MSSFAWDRWKNRSWLRLVFWLTAIFAIIAWMLWIADFGRIWQIACLTSAFASMSFRILGKASDMLQD